MSSSELNEAEAFVQSFVAQPYVEELLGLVRNHPRGLSSDRTLGMKLNPDTVIVVSQPDCLAAAQEILRTLRSLGASDDCWVIACDTLDTGRNKLGWVIPDVVGFSVGTVVSCVRGELAFIEDRWDRHLILSRPRGTTTTLV